MGLYGSLWGAVGRYGALWGCVDPQILRRGCHVDDRDGLTDMTLLHYACKAGAHGVGARGHVTGHVMGHVTGHVRGHVMGHGRGH